MSKSNLQNEPIERRSEPLQNGDQPDSNDRASLQDLPKTHAVLSDIETNKQAQEAVIDLENATNEDTKIEIIPSIDYLMYGYYGKQIQPPKTTWVMFQGGPNFQGGAMLPDGHAPLDYNPSSRNLFVRLTFSIVLIMILLTATFVGIVLFVEDLNDAFLRKGIILAIPAMIVMIGLNYAIACSPCTRIFPCNIIVLFIAVVCMSIICAFITCRYRTQIVLYALISTCIVVFVCVLLAFSGFDFTAWMLYVVVIAAAFGAITLVVFIGMMITGTYMKMLHLIILIVGTLLNVIILTMELQMVLGGGTIELGEDDYALGAFLIYSSIIDIFLKLVQILGILDNM